MKRIWSTIYLPSSKDLEIMELRADISEESRHFKVDNKEFRILALAGSLRQGSYNRGLLRAAEELAPDWVKVQFFDIGTLPFFNEDLEAAEPDVVRQFKQAISNANAILIAT